MKILCFLFLAAIQHACLLDGKEPGENESNLSQKIERFSRREGFDIATALKNHSEWIDLSCVIQGIQDYLDGKTPQSVIDLEGGVSYSRIIIQLFEQASKNNLQKAESFLQTLENKPQLHSLEKGKLWYEIVKEGSGTDCVKKESTPLLHYSIVTLDGEGIVNTRLERHPYKVPLEETIPGFAKGVEGMRVGEKRKIFIHPDLGYGKIGYMPPNSLLVVEVEVIGL